MNIVEMNRTGSLMGRSSNDMLLMRARENNLENQAVANGVKNIKKVAEKLNSEVLSGKATATAGAENYDLLRITNQHINLKI